MASAPPAYDAVVQPLAKLTYADFWPDCLTPNEKVKRASFETFDKLIYKANNFLEKRGDITLKNVETIEKKVSYVPDIYNGCMTYAKSETTGVYMKGLRLWFSVMPPQVCGSPVQIGYFNIHPARQNPGEKHPIFEKLSEVAQKLNTQFDARPLEGKILTIDTVSVKVYKELWLETDGVLNWDECRWIDAYDRHMYNFFRIFFIRGPPMMEKFGFQDFCPTREKHHSAFDEFPTYESYHDMLSKTRQWLQQYGENKKITNIQTLETPYYSSDYTGDHDIHLLTINPFHYKIEPYPRVSFLRLYYLVGPNVPIERPPLLTSRAFIPGYLGDQGWQDMHSIMKYALSWLHASGANVLCAEMVGPIKKLLIKESGLGGTEHTIWDGEWYFTHDKHGRHGPFSHKVCYYIRVFLDGVYREPPAESLPEIPKEYDGGCSLM